MVILQSTALLQTEVSRGLGAGGEEGKHGETGLATALGSSWYEYAVNA